ncbi:MAG: hypothetical protein JRG71_13680 [Deltaproteobacteria bacterium]|nr:hypothetical protein [Deltaproteobacteria bacterium]
MPDSLLDVDNVLSLFGTTTKAARQGYHQFVVDGMEMGKRPELMGGGLRRSQVLSQTSDKNIVIC